MQSAIPAQERLTQNALTVVVSCVNPTWKRVADATRSSARPALNGRSSTSHDATRRDFFHASMTRGSQAGIAIGLGSSESSETRTGPSGVRETVALTAGAEVAGCQTGKEIRGLPN